MNGHKVTWIALLALALAMPIVSATTNTEGCDVTTTPAMELPNGIYMQGTAYNIWQEANGIPGLQFYKTSCDDGREFPRDECIAGLGMSNWGNIYCPTDYVFNRL